MNEIICRDCGVRVAARGHGIYCLRCSLELMSQLEYLEGSTGPMWRP